MEFLLQLRLLIWKNFKIRKRQKVRLFIEIVWPLFLFIILVLVRLRGLRKYHHQCFFDEKAMPSSGLIYFAQSFVCTFNNTCHKEPPTVVTQTSTYNDSFISQLVSDVESALAKNFNQARADALADVFKDLYTLQQMAQKVGTQIFQGQGIQGLSVKRIDSLLKEPFGPALLNWSASKGLDLTQAELSALLRAQLRPEKVTAAEILTMLTDPRTAICDPELISRAIHADDVTPEQFQESLRPLCNLSLEDALELLRLVESHVDYEAIQKEINEFSFVTGGSSLSISAYRTIIQASEDVRREMFEKESIKKVFGDTSDLLRRMTEQLTMDVGNETLSNNSFFLRNTSQNSRLAFAAFQRIVCNRNMSSEQLFSDGGAANRFDELRDQLKEKDEKLAYEYDNTTSKECNDLMMTLEENKLTGFLWDQLKPFIRGKILFTPDTAATRRIVGVVNDTFRPIGDIHRLARAWINTYADRVRGLFLDEENQQFIKEAFTTDGPGSLLDLLLNSNVTKALNAEGTIPLVDVDNLKQTLRNYFAGNYSLEWKETFENIDNIIKQTSVVLSCFDFNKFVGMPSERSLEVEGIKLIRENKLWAGVVFVDFPQKDDDPKLPEFIQYKIKMDSDKVDSTRYIEDRLSRPGPRRRPGIDLKYLYFGFAYLQDMLEHAMISIQSGRNKSSLPGVSLQQMPYPCYIEDRFVIAIARTFPLFMTIAWVYSASMMIKSIVREKELRLKETMRTMGMANAVHWVSWFVDAFSLMSLSAFMLTIILKYGDILTKSDPSVIFVFMLSYTVSTITLCFLVSTFFSRANVAASAGGIIFFCFYLPYSFMVVWEEQLSSDIKITSCLISNIAFGFGCAYFAHFEESGIGAQWSNIWSSPLNEDSFSLGGASAMLALDAFIYGLIAWYVEAVWPGQYGVPKPWYFFLTKSYWIGGTRSNITRGDLSPDASESDAVGGDYCRYVETEPTHLPLGVSVQHLSKVYSDGKVAVEDLSLNFYEGQITSFLGHNGAGKTTTISILTGLFPPSAGTAQINGLDIRKDMDTIRKSLGMCPQHNVLFDDLTVYEHLWFYAKMKDIDNETIEREANSMIMDLGLPHKTNELSKRLSGGMQRKLSIAAAFVGGSKTVVLDEPTAGVDPYSRRSIWDLLLKYKSGRTILLTTHFMDEADLLGDRIAIINNGKLVCVGSSLFLRTQFGNGYYLTLVKEEEGEESEPGTASEDHPDSATATASEASAAASRVNSAKDIEHPKAAIYAPSSAAQISTLSVRASSGSAPTPSPVEVAPTEVEHGDHDGDSDNSTDISDIIKHIQGVSNDGECGEAAGAAPDDSEIPLMDEESVKGEVEGRRRSSLERNPSMSLIGSESIENDILIDDEGISDVSKRNGIIINPSRSQSFAANYPITKFIQKYVHGSRLLEQIGSEVIYVLPTDDVNSVKKFEQLFADLDRYMDRMKIKNYGLSDTTLEEIFLKVASNPYDGDDSPHVTNRVRSASESSGLRYFFKNSKKCKDRKKITPEGQDQDVEIRDGAIELKTRTPPTPGESVKYEEVPRMDKTDMVDGPHKTSKIVYEIDEEEEDPKNERSLFWKHIKALEIKRFHHSKRNKKGIIAEIVLPAAFICLAMIFTLIMPPLEEQRPIELHPWMYPTAGDYPSHTFYSNEHPAGDWPRRYEEELLSRTGMGTRCINRRNFPDLKPCKSDPPDTSRFSTPDDVLANITMLPCSCAIGTQVCPANAEGFPQPPRLEMPSFDILHNLTGRDINAYLLKTRDQFYKRRYGGFEFGVKNPLANRNFTLGKEAVDRWLKATNNNKSRFDPLTRDLVFGNVEDLALSSSVFDNVRVWFNNKGWAASMAYMNALNNMVLRASIRAQNDDFDSDWNDFKDPEKYGISVISQPMNYTKEQLDTEVIRQIGISLLHAICVIFAMSFIPASFVLFHIEERITKVRHLQFVSGVSVTTYWVAAFLWDLTMFTFSAFLCILLFLAFDAEAYVSKENFPSLVIIMFLYGFSSVTLMYPASFIFSVPSSAFVSLSCANLFVGIITTVTTFILENFEDEELEYIGSILREVFLIFPHYCLGRGLMDMATEVNINLIVARFGYVSVRNRYSWDFLGKYMVCMTVQGIVFFLFTIAVQLRLWRMLPKINFSKLNPCKRTSKNLGEDGLTMPPHKHSEEEDVDVARERERVMASSGNDYVLTVKGLSKRFSQRSPLAVDRLTFGVRKGECFGLLGVNGAGKTTTFKMLTGDTDPTAGDAILNGHSLLDELAQVRRSLGYCPQFDALNPLLTGREHLRLYARLRGLDEENVKKVADWGLKKLNLLPYADRCAGTYSGGNKRKLSTAIALVGNPSIVFLDEPTTGMDPGARRFLWNCILDLVRSGQSVVLTSHSMEECEALCTRLGIMVNGRFQCLGSAQHLKSRFGTGYTLTLRAAEADGASAALKAAVTAAFPAAELREEHCSQLVFQLAPQAARLPDVFKEMEKAKAEKGLLEDYSITQTTLDEVFIRFASKQTEMTEAEMVQDAEECMASELKV